ncbi:MAG: hypothetical protein RLZZ511_1803 [Cyanobacteriota bacterium]|jgi:hypothetical protein
MQRFKFVSLFLVSIGAAITSHFTMPQTAQAAPDPVVKAALEKANLKYTVLDNDNFKVVMTFLDVSRKQTVYINSAVDKLPNSSSRKIYAFPTSAQINDKALDYALLRSDRNVIGGWEATASDALVYVAKVNSNLNAKELQLVINEVSVAADELEREMNLADEK